jgi:predicted nucleotidyltransferase
MLSTKKISTIIKTLENIDSIVFAYLHGTAFSSKNYKDIDIALFVNPKDYESIIQNNSPTLDFIIPLEQKLEQNLHLLIDMQIINNAPLAFRFNIVNHSIILIDKNPLTRELFELLSRVEYFDFKPKSEEYLREALV